MAEQKITVTLDPGQVARLQQFVRDEFRKAYGPRLVTPLAEPIAAELADLRAKIDALAGEYQREPRWLRSVDVGLLMEEWIS